MGEVLPLLGRRAPRRPNEPGRLHLNAKEAVKQVDENTIGVVAILGSTFDGSYEPVKEIADALDARPPQAGRTCPVHVDAASGGFVAPFIDPEPRMGLPGAPGALDQLLRAQVRAGVPRSRLGDLAQPEDLPEDLVFHVNYLGGDMPTFALNFSRPGGQVIAQYYNFIRLGREGFREIQQACRDTAMYTAAQIAKLGPYELLSDGSQLPVFFFRLKPEVTNYTVYDVSAKLRERAGRCLRTPCRSRSRTCPGCGWSCATGSAATWPTCSSTTSDGPLRSWRACRCVCRPIPATRSRSGIDPDQTDLVCPIEIPPNATEVHVSGPRPFVTRSTTGARTAKWWTGPRAVTGSPPRPRAADVVDRAAVRDRFGLLRDRSDPRIETAIGMTATDTTFSSGRSSSRRPPT